MYGTTVALNPTYFIGMDLHSNNVVVCVLQNAANQAGQLIKKVCQKAFKNSTDKASDVSTGGILK